ncbi:MAG TPA: ATP-binding cassette domain-containing protein [Elusimicrobiales bacterium]|nr:ATP-binding cassette domain-containing protein [Elusimicrobiales bacterium]
MIRIEKLTRKYGNLTAVENVSFEIPSGKIVGFLGPNGAGKTTTLKMLTGFLAPTEGNIVISGLDMENNLSTIKNMIGYLPEDNPLYEDMTVFDYLLWSGKLKGLKGQKLIDAVKNSAEVCGLSEVITKLIGHLSKGYRQRTAIANAILHNPVILFLDEPTSGLDPNQAHQMRKLIKSLGKEKTIMLSTHILTEAKEVCDEIIIINKGKIVAKGDTEMLLSGGEKEQKIILITEKNLNPEEVKQKLSDFGKCAFSKTENEYKFTIETQKKEDVRKNIFNFIIEHKIPVLEFKKETISLEELFRKLTL